MPGHPLWPNSWELLYPAVATPVVYRGLQSHRFIGVAWLMHACWDLPHHVWGNPVWPFMPTSSFGCMIFDALIAVWFLAGAPGLIGLMTAASQQHESGRVRGSRISAS